MRITCFLLVIAALTSRAQIGTLDTNFNAAFQAWTLKLQTDNRILAGGPNGLVRLNTNGAPAPNFTCNVTGAVECIDIQDDGKIVFGGNFTSVNGTPRSNVARLNSDGSLDTNFVTSGISSFVFAIAVQSDGAILIGGEFATIGGVSRPGIARLNSNGSLDAFFDSGSGVAAVRSIAVQPDGRLVIGGVFSSVNGVSRNNIARLNSNGSLDSTFVPQPGPNGYVLSVALQQDSKLIIGGNFDQVDNIPNVRIARLNTNGTVDTTFNAGSGASGIIGGIPVWSVACRQNGDVFLAGGFSTVNGAQRNGLAKLHSNGTLDSDFVPNLPAGSRMNSILVQPDGYLIFADGVAGFSTVYRMINFPPSTGPATASLAVYPGLTIQGTVGGRYRIEYLNNVASSNWSFLKQIVLPSSPFLFFDISAVGQAARFYRVVESP
jgi:uncharacterized delta-60 repeat protein